MKVQLNLNIHIVLIMFVVTGCFSGNKPIRYAHVPDNIKGIWVSDTTRITVRTSPRFMKFEFHQGMGYYNILIGDSTASGRIGEATFEKAPIIKNSGDPYRNGIAYSIKCGTIGKIFPSDPVEQKEVTIQIGPLINGQMESLLRLTENGAKYPMSGFILERP